MKLNNYKIAVIGLGYLGKNIFSYLKSLNTKVLGITKKNLDVLKKEDFDYVINCAGTSGDYREKLIETIESNINLNCYILQNAKIKYSYLYFSSSRIYGFTENDKIIFDENFYNNYNNLDLSYIYDGTKKLTESLLVNYFKKVNYKIAIIRLSNVYGNFDCYDDSTLIKKIIRYKKESLKNLSVKENRYSQKDYIHIKDVMENIIKVLINIKNSDVFNLAYGKSFSLDDILKVLNFEIKSDESRKKTYSKISNKKIKKEFSICLKYNLLKELKKLDFINK